MIPLTLQMSILPHKKKKKKIHDYSSDPPENCHLNIKKLLKTCNCWQFKNKEDIFRQILKKM